MTAVSGGCVSRSPHRFRQEQSCNSAEQPHAALMLPARVTTMASGGMALLYAPIRHSIDAKRCPSPWVPTWSPPPLQSDLYYRMSQGQIAAVHPDFSEAGVAACCPAWNMPAGNQSNQRALRLYGTNGFTQPRSYLASPLRQNRLCNRGKASSFTKQLAERNLLCIDGHALAKPRPRVRCGSRAHRPRHCDVCV